MGANASLYAGLLQTTAGATNSLNQASAARAQGDYESGVAAFNARVADSNAELAKMHGDRVQLEVARRASQIKGKQKASLAAQGIVTSSGSAAKVIEETDELAYIDQVAAHNNAAREAFGYKVQAANYEGASTMAKITARNIATNTLITGGMNAVSTGTKAYGDWWKENKAPGVVQSTTYYTKAARIKGGA